MYLFLTQPPTLLPFGEIFEAVGGAALCLFVLLDVPRQLGGDVSDKVAAGPQTVIVAPHSELAVLQIKHKGFQFHELNRSESRTSSVFVCKVKVNAVNSFFPKQTKTSHISKDDDDVFFPFFFLGLPTKTPPLERVCTPPSA